jgi:hypothetical protein
MSAHQEVHPHSLNRLLASLPSEELTALHPHMEQVSLSHGQRLILPHEPIHLSISLLTHCFLW